MFHLQPASGDLIHGDRVNNAIQSEVYTEVSQVHAFDFLLKKAFHSKTKIVISKNTLIDSASQGLSIWKKRKTYSFGNPL